MSDHSQHLDGAPLGNAVDYIDRYAPELLYPIPRAPQREGLGLAPEQPLPFVGADLWNAYELSWLNPRGKPVVAIGKLRVPANSTSIIESKSLKLYFNSFAQTTFASLEEVQAAMTRDLSAAAGASVAVFLWEVSTLPERPLNNFSGTLLDDLDIETRAYRPAPELLKADTGDAQVEEQLVSHLLRSNCPVTGQPDWASVCIHYRGPTIDHAGLLAYIVSFRQHSDFHEHCVERIFLDVWAQCRPTFLSVYARYTRRGGIDINPFRSSAPEPDPENGGDIRQ